MPKSNFVSDLKFLCQNWSEMKDLDFFWLKVKYAIWIVPVPFLLWLIALVVNLLLWLGVL